MAQHVVKIDTNVSYPRRRMTFAVMRELEPYEDQLGELMSKVDGIDAQMASCQQALVDLADKGEATPDKVEPLVAQEAALTAQRRAIGREQQQVRLAMLAVRLEGATSDALAEQVDVGGGQLEELEELLTRPPSTDRGGSPS